MLVIEHLDFEGRKLDVALKLVLLDVFDVRHPPWVDIFRQTPPREYDVRLKLCQCNEFRAQLQSFYTILPPWPPTQSSAAQAADGNFPEYGIDTKHGSSSRALKYRNTLVSRVVCYTLSHWSLPLFLLHPLLVVQEDLYTS